MPAIVLTKIKIGDQEVNSVSARDLYLDLGMDKSNWAKWSRINIVENKFFKDGVDYVGFVLSTNGNETSDFIPLNQKLSDKSKGNFAQDYAVTIIKQNIGGEEVNAVSARDLYLDLGLSKGDWAIFPMQNAFSVLPDYF